MMRIHDTSGAHQRIDRRPCGERLLRLRRGRGEQLAVVVEKDGFLVRLDCLRKAFALCRELRLDGLTIGRGGSCEGVLEHTLREPFGTACADALHPRQPVLTHGGQLTNYSVAPSQ